MTRSWPRISIRRGEAMRWNFRRCQQCPAYFVPTAPHQQLCQTCRVEAVTVAALPDEPRHAWELTINDTRFLRSIKVLPESA